MLRKTLATWEIDGNTLGKEKPNKPSLLHCLCLYWMKHSCGPFTEHHHQTHLGRAIEQSRNKKKQAILL